MNTIQLNTILEQDRYVGSIFRGVYPIDQLPTIRDGAYVINTAPHNHEGLHWLAILIKNDNIEYFDSYGGEPPAKLLRWGKKKQWTINPVQLQSPLTSVCGQYCIYYLFHRARGIDLRILLNDFGSDVDDNDKLVYDFVEDRYELVVPTMIDTNKVISQLAQAQVSDPSIRKIASGQLFCSSPHSKMCHSSEDWI